jgi:YVTN family beta-propeller protein
VWAVSSPSATTHGVVTLINYSGDSIMATAQIGIDPTAFTLDSGSNNGYTIDGDGTLSVFPLSSTLQNNQVLYTTLPPSAQPVNLFPIATTSRLWAADLSENGLADVFIGTPPTLNNAIPVAQLPVMLAGSGNGALRYFVISQNIVSATGVECNAASPNSAITQNGLVTGIEATSNATDPAIPVGRCPVYAVQSNDSRRLFVLNRASDTISVINTLTDTLDNQCPKSIGGCVNLNGQKYYTHPTLPLSQAALTAANAPTNCNYNTDPTCSLPADGGLPVNAAGPVYAEYNYTTSQLIVANYDGGTVSVIDVSLDEYGNDSPTFGTTFTIPVGKNPAGVTALFDGSRAYTANQTDGTVTVVNLTSHTVEKTLPVTGNPRSVVSIQNSTMGKVYVVAPNTNVLTIIRTDQDIVDTTILLEGNTLDVRVSTQSATSGNSLYTTRSPGYGQPCNKPITAPATLAACQAMQ